MFDKNSGATWTISSFRRVGSSSASSQKEVRFSGGHPVHRQVNIAALVKISPGPGAEENQFPGSMPAGQLTELTIDLFHGYLLGRFPAVITVEMPTVSFLLS